MNTEWFAYDEKTVSLVFHCYFVNYFSITLIFVQVQLFCFNRFNVEQRGLMRNCIRFYMVSYFLYLRKSIFFFLVNEMSSYRTFEISRTIFIIIVLTIYSFKSKYLIFSIQNCSMVGKICCGIDIIFL